uniref:histidine kinase n=1 Tax=uncultured Elusimicrobia bacterium TaxID=699876 RepID=A0A650EMD5_9BACT|nr:hypothetical protein Elusimicrob2101_0760 [uncultured Elusimicrobia bacterium]
MQEENKVNLNVRALSLISHKLKTPLSIINGYSEAILSQAGKEKFSPFTSKALEEINKQGKRMSQLVDKLFAFNKVSAATADTLERKPVALKQLIKDCAAHAIALNEDAAPEPVPQDDSSVRRGTFVEIDCPEGLSVTANEEMLRMGVQELLANSIKFNNKMEKIIKVQCANHGGSVSLSVRDYGVGIRPQDVNRIFEPFYQVDDSFTGQVNGWGLGLPMLKKILDLHGGSISVVSDRGLGSIVTINFPTL